MFALTDIYLVQSLICLMWIDEADFQKAFENAQFGTEIYEYSVTMERMKILHAISLSSLAFFVLKATSKFKLLNETHYAQLLLASVVITFLYFIPLVYLLVQAFWMAY